MGKPLQIYATAFILVCSTAHGQDVQRDALPELMAECQSQREENIAPLRDQAIEDCVTKRRWERSRCESHMRTYGQRHVTGTPAGLFWNLPVCETAFAADRHFKMNPRSMTYSP